MEEIEKYKLANNNLSKELNEALRTNERMCFEIEELRERVSEFKKAYQNKMQVAKILVEHGGVSYVMLITESTHTPEGLFITGRI